MKNWKINLAKQVKKYSLNCPQLTETAKIAPKHPLTNQTTTMAINRDPNDLGSSFMLPPHVIDDTHIKAELGRYRIRGFSLTTLGSVERKLAL